jgi:hypothetical protein
MVGMMLLDRPDRARIQHRSSLLLVAVLTALTVRPSSGRAARTPNAHG